MATAGVQVLDLGADQAMVKLGAVCLTVPRGALQDRGGHTTLELESVSPGRKPEFRVVRVSGHPYGIQLHQSQLEETETEEAKEKE